MSLSLSGPPPLGPGAPPSARLAAFYAAIATLAVGPLALGNQGWYARFLASRPMVWLGEISYEIFLIHLIVMEIAMVEVLHWRVYTGSMAWLFVVTLAMTIPLAWLLHRLTRVPPPSPVRRESPPSSRR